MSMVAGEVIYDSGEFTRVNRNEVTNQAMDASAAFQELVAADPTVEDVPIVQLTRDGKI
jgi:hypothetical protein